MSLNNRNALSSIKPSKLIGSADFENPAAPKTRKMDSQKMSIMKSEQMAINPIFDVYRLVSTK